MRLSILITIITLIGGYLLVQHIRHHRMSSLTTMTYLRRLRIIISSAVLIVFIIRFLPLQRLSSTISDAETMIMLDVSKSMLVSDSRKKLSRLDSAKEMIGSLMLSTPAQKRGLGIFAGDTQGVLPLTADGELLTTFLAGLDHRNLTKQGTNLAEAIIYASQRFSSGDHQKTILFFSDGGEEEIVVSQQVKDILKNQQIATWIVGIGSSAGGPIPEGMDLFGNVVYKQRQGETVVSKLGESSLKELAKTVNGDYLSEDRFVRTGLPSSSLGKTGSRYLVGVIDLLVVIMLALTLGIIGLHLGNKFSWFEKHLQNGIYHVRKILLDKGSLLSKRGNRAGVTTQNKANVQK